MGLVHFSDNSSSSEEREEQEQIGVSLPQRCGAYGQIYSKPAFEQGCFYCGKKFDPDGSFHSVDRSVIHWEGWERQGETKKGSLIFLHGDCVMSLVVRLTSDYHAWETTFLSGRKDVRQVRREYLQRRKEENEG